MVIHNPLLRLIRKPVAGVAALVCFGACFSQVASEPEPQTVIINTIRSPLSYSFEKAVEASRKVQAASGGSARLMVRLIDKEPEQKPPLSVRLEWDGGYLPVALDALNRFVVPQVHAAHADAELVVNRSKGSVAVGVDIEPVVDAAAPLTTATLETTIDGGRRARAALLPWYARLVTPTVNALRICHTAADAVLYTADAAGKRTALAITARQDEAQRTVYCHDFYPNRSAAAATDVVALPADATFEYVGTAF